MAVMTYVGFIGAITGMSSAPFGICEKVRSHRRPLLLSVTRRVMTRVGPVRCGVPTRATKAALACRGTFCSVTSSR
jgi:hypothetical protein